MAKVCKGCGRPFSDPRANVKFCLPECARVAKQIAWHQRRIEQLQRIQAHISTYGRAPVEDFQRFRTRPVDVQPVTGEWF